MSEKPIVAASVESDLIGTRHTHIFYDRVKCEFVVFDEAAHELSRKPSFKEAEAELQAYVAYLTSPNPEQLVAQNARLREALTKYETAWEELFAHCLSNGVFNAWGQAVPCANLNEAHRFAGEVLK